MDADYSSDFTFLIASDRERDEVFCEIYYRNEIVAEISKEIEQETEKFTLSLYPHPKNWWEFNLNEFQKVLEAAKKHLVGTCEKTEDEWLAEKTQQVLEDIQSGKETLVSWDEVKNDL